MNFSQNIAQSYQELGKFLSQFTSDGIHKKLNILHNDIFFEDFKQQIKLAQEHNGWFTESNILFALENWSKLLIYSNINQWLRKYNFNIKSSKKIAIIMAGNIPLVGFHDLLSVLISGHEVLVKQSSNDKYLLPYLVKYLVKVQPELDGKVVFTEGTLSDFDAAIATGSNNSARYFEYYFKNKPSIIRRNRNSVAVLQGNETSEQLKGLSEDIFRYYGLGCRNVSKIFVPEDYNFDSFFNAIYHWHPIIHENKYANNYDYNKAVYLMSEIKILDNGFLILKEDSGYSSPIATLFYETYKSKDEIKAKLNSDKDQIQCIVSSGIVYEEVGFGQTQVPNLWDYADGIDTVEFLLKI